MDSSRYAVLAVCVGVLSLTLIGACSKKSSSSSGGAAAATSYPGTWSLYNTPHAGSGTCNTALNIEANHGTFVVDSAGAYSITLPNGGPVITGTILSFSGVVSGTITDPACGNGSMTGSCSSYSACSGTFAQTGGASGSMSGGWRFAR